MEIISKRIIRINICLFVILFSPAAGLFLSTPAFSQTPLLLGVHPFLPVAVIEQKFTPLVNYLIRKVGRPIVLRVGSSFAEHIDAIGRDQLDIAYISPVAYVEMVEKYGRKPLLACLENEGSPFFTGIIFVRSEIKTESLADLPTGDLAFVDSHSTMGYLLPRIMILNAKPMLITGHHYQFLRTHENVVLGVLSGDFVAGAVKNAIYQKFKNRGLKALAVTPPVAEHLLLTRSNLDQELIESLRAALLSLKSLPAEKAVLTTLKPSLTGFSPVKDADYDSLRKLITASKTRGGK